MTGRRAWDLVLLAGLFVVGLALFRLAEMVFPN